jgi:hypothetical protein
MELPKGISMKLLTNHPDRIDSVRLIVDVNLNLLENKRGYGVKLLQSLSPVSVIVMVFKACIEEMGYKVDLERTDSGRP